MSTLDAIGRAVVVKCVCLKHISDLCRRHCCRPEDRSGTTSRDGGIREIGCVQAPPDRSNRQPADCVRHGGVGSRHTLDRESTAGQHRLSQRGRRQIRCHQRQRDGAISHGQQDAGRAPKTERSFSPPAIGLRGLDKCDNWQRWLDQALSV